MTDPDSKTPAFKAVPITLEPDSVLVNCPVEQAGGRISLEITA